MDLVAHLIRKSGDLRSRTLSCWFRKMGISFGYAAALVIDNQKKTALHLASVEVIEWFAANPEAGFLVLQSS